MYVFKGHIMKVILSLLFFYGYNEYKWRGLDEIE